MKYATPLLLALLLLPLAAAPADSEAPDHLVFGFLPIVSPERLVRRFAPLVDYLSAKLGVEVRMETAPDFSEFLRRTQQERRYDLLFTAPHFYHLAQRHAGYRALVRVDRPGMRAVIVVPRDSPVRKLADLRGRRLATVDPLALATELVRARLARDGLDPDRDLTLVATPSHNASLLSACQGRTDAASLMLPLFRRASPGVCDDMRIVATTAASPHMPVSVAPWVDAQLAQHIRAILLDMRRDAAGRAVLEPLDWPGFTAAGPHDYDGLDWAVTRLEAR